MTAPTRRLDTTKLRLLPEADRIALGCYYRCMSHERDTGGVEARKIVNALNQGDGMVVPDRFWTHVCCRCEEQGAVVPRNGTSTCLPIDWKCRGCGKLVCHNCTLTVPGSVPLRFREDTLCSVECWIAIGSPREDEEMDGAGSG